MRFYATQHRFYAGIDLHARTMHLCVLDAARRRLRQGLAVPAGVPAPRPGAHGAPWNCLP